MNSDSNNPKRSRLWAMFALLALIAFTPFAIGGSSLRYGTDGTSGQPVKVKTTPASDAVRYVPNGVTEPITASSSDVHAPTSNTAAVVTYAANATKKHVIYGIAWSYTGGSVTGGNLKVEDVSGTTVFTQDIDARGQGYIIFPRPLRGAAINTAMIITLAAGGSGVSGKVSVLGHDLETP